MTWAITCSLASSHGIRLPLHQISSLALMAIEALLFWVTEWFSCQVLPGHLAKEISGTRRPSLTGDYNRARGPSAVQRRGGWQATGAKQNKRFAFSPIQVAVHTLVVAVGRL